MNKKILSGLFLLTSLALTGCRSVGDAFLPEDERPLPPSSLNSTNNCLYIALYNYYGQVGSNFTHRWLGMKRALKEFGIEVTGDENQPSAQKFVIDYSSSKLPKDFKLHMVNNKTWDPGLQYKDLGTDKPYGIIATTNGVEFAYDQVLANSEGTKISTFMDNTYVNDYKDAMSTGNIGYLGTTVNAEKTGLYFYALNEVLHDKNINGFKMFHGSNQINYSQNVVTIHDINTFNKIFEMNNDVTNPVIRNQEIGKYIRPNSFDYDTNKLLDFYKTRDFEYFYRSYNQNKTNPESFTQLPSVNIGIIQSGTLTEERGNKITQLKNILQKYYNATFKTEIVSGTNPLDKCANKLSYQNVDIIINFQNDPTVSRAIEIATNNYIYFVNSFNINLNYYPRYYIGSVGVSNEKVEKYFYKITKAQLSDIQKRGVVSRS